MSASILEPIKLQEVAAASSTLQIALANNSSTAGPVDIENVIGSHFDDHITGNSLNNHLLGEDGRDRLETGGNSGSTPEILDGGQGDDTLVVSPGSVATQLLETMGSDTFVFAAGNLGTVTIDAQFVTENQGTDTLDFMQLILASLLCFDDASPQQVAPDTGNLQLELKYVEIGPNPQRLIPVRIENVVGSSYDDELVGSEFANQIRGGAGNDIIRGGEGDDELSGEGGNDRLEGQAGHDRLLGGDDDDLLQGGAGNDWLDGGSGNLSTLAGGDNDDHYVVSEVSATTVAIAEHAGGGVDTLWLSQSTGPQGAVADLDQVAAAPVFAGVTLDLATQAQGQIENIVGTQYADTLFGSSADNLISGLGGDDFLSGRDGNDTLSGGSGRDRILGGNHDDYLSGGADDDELFGEANDDFLNGGDGDDTLVAGTGGDALDPGPGNDTLDETSLPIIDFAAGLEAAEVLLGSILYTVPSVAAFVSQQGVTPQNKIHHTIANLIGPAKTVDIAITVPGQPTFSKTITVIGAEVDQQILTALNESGFFAPGDFAVSTIGPINFQETTVVEFTGAYAETEVSLDVQGGTTPGQQVYTIVAQPAAQGVDERALLTADAAVVNGFFHLSYGGVVSAAIPTDASAAELAAAIEAIASRAVSVSKTAAAQWEVTFARFAAADLVPRAAGPDVQISWGDGSAVAAATLTPAGPFSLGSSQQVDIFGTHTYSLSGGTIIKVAVSGASQHGVAHPTLKLGARIAAVDTDADGLTDDIELDIGSDPHNPDTDGDRLPDKFEFDSELLNLTGPDAPDVDGDGLTNRQEFEIGTDPDLPDTDHDGLTDLQESDLDGDGLIYQEEIDLETDPNRFDTDGDLLSDGFEVNSTTLDPRTADDLEGDHDADGLSNFLEQIFGTDPDDPDSDGDQVSDGDEIAQGSDPHLDSDFAAPDDSQLVGLQLTVGDFSGSHSERYDLAVGALLHQAPQFGVVVTNLYEAFRSGRTYSIRLFHRGSNLSSPDYDYIADVALPAESAGLIVIEDPEQILGTHYDRDTFFAQSSNPRVAYFHTPLVDLDITRPTVVDQREATSGVRVAVNDDDDDGDGRSDDIDAVILGENDVVTLTLRSLLPVAIPCFPGRSATPFPGR